MIDAAPLTPLQDSAARTGRRYFACLLPVYQALTAAIDESRGYPIGTTVRGLPEADSLPKDPAGRVLISVETTRMTDADNAMLAPVIAAGQVEELTAAAFTALLPATPVLNN